MAEQFKALTIAGSDTSGGAGMEADLKTFEEMGVYGMVALTVLRSFSYPSLFTLW